MRCQPLQEPLPDTYQHHPLAALRHLLADLNRLEQRYRYLLILDEYELLDDRLPATTAEDFVTTLRGATIPLVGSRPRGFTYLQERSASYYQPIYTWRPLKVGLMNAAAVADMLQVEDDSFPLEYSLEAVARVHDLTGGQPSWCN